MPSGFMTNKFQLLYCIVSEFPPVVSAGYSTLWDHDWRRKLFVQPRREGKGTAGENRLQDVHAAKTFENSRLAAAFKGRVLPGARSPPGCWLLTAGRSPGYQQQGLGTPAGRGEPPGDTTPRCQVPAPAWVWLRGNPAKKCAERPRAAHVSHTLPLRPAAIK